LQSLAAKPDAKAELQKAIIKLLKANGFAGKGSHFDFNGTLTQPIADKLDGELRRLGMERSPGRNTYSWFDRNRGILVRIGGKTGEQYYA
jgi:hypothetical protein